MGALELPRLLIQTKIKSMLAADSFVARLSRFVGPAWDVG
jgi:hypothetical protein